MHGKDFVGYAGAALLGLSVGYGLQRSWWGPGMPNVSAAFERVRNGSQSLENLADCCLGIAMPIGLIAVGARFLIPRQPRIEERRYRYTHHG